MCVWFLAYAYLGFLGLWTLSQAVRAVLTPFLADGTSRAQALLAAFVLFDKCVYHGTCEHRPLRCLRSPPAIPISCILVCT